jgi:hypothetical protein
MDTPRPPGASSVHPRPHEVPYQGPGTIFCRTGRARSLSDDLQARLSTSVSFPALWLRDCRCPFLGECATEVEPALDLDRSPSHPRRRSSTRPTPTRSPPSGPDRPYQEGAAPPRAGLRSASPRPVLKSVHPHFSRPAAEHPLPRLSGPTRSSAVPAHNSLAGDRTI